MKIRVSRIMDFSPEDFNRRLKSDVTVLYDDGLELTHTARELAVNRYIYSLIELAPDVGVQSRYSVCNYYVGGQYVGNTINRAFEAILEDIIRIYVPRTGGRKFLETVYEKMYLILEDIYNNIVYDHLECVMSLSIKDFLKIQLKPELLDAISEIKIEKSSSSVKKSYAVLDNIIRTSDDLKNNPIALGYISGTIGADQVKQLLACRGFVSEIDGSIFKYPIASSFVLGLSDLYEVAVESRSGAKALYLSNRAISISEYFAREMQITTMNVEKLEDGDCGNKDFIEWTVTDNDFNNLLGKHYFVDGKELVIHKNSRSIIGTTIHIRNINRCKLPNKRNICAACFGDLSGNIPIHANLGHITLTVLSAIISQLILSTKHMLASASSDNITLTADMKEYFLVKNKNSYAFRANAINRKKFKYSLCISQDQGFGITDIHKSPDVNKVNLSRVSRMEIIYLSVEDADGKVTEVPLSIRQNRRFGSFTYAFLQHIKDNGYTLDSNDRIVISLDGWKSGVPIIGLPQIEFSYIDLAKAISAEFKYMKTEVKTPEARLHRVFDLVNSRLNINIALLEVIVYAFTAKDPDNRDYDLSRGSDVMKPQKMSSILTHRSLGGAYAWEDVLETLLNPNSFYGANAVDHPLDVLLTPNEVLRDYYGKL